MESNTKTIEFSEYGESVEMDYEDESIINPFMFDESPGPKVINYDTITPTHPLNNNGSQSTLDEEPNERNFKMNTEFKLDTPKEGKSFCSFNNSIISNLSFDINQNKNLMKVTINIGRDEEYVGYVDEKFVRQGFGTFKHKNGDVYEGFFKDGLREGHGEYFFNDGSVYVGEWKQDKKHGYGLLKYDNKVVKGEWVQDKLLEGFTLVIEIKKSQYESGDENSGVLNYIDFKHNYSISDNNSCVSIDFTNNKETRRSNSPVVIPNKNLKKRGFFREIVIVD